MKINNIEIKRRQPFKFYKEQVIRAILPLKFK